MRLIEMALKVTPEEYDVFCDAMARHRSDLAERSYDGCQGAREELASLESLSGKALDIVGYNYAEEY